MKLKGVVVVEPNRFPPGEAPKAPAATAVRRASILKVHGTRAGLQSDLGRHRTRVTRQGCGFQRRSQWTAERWATTKARGAAAWLGGGGDPPLTGSRVGQLGRRWGESLTGARMGQLGGRRVGGGGVLNRLGAAGPGGAGKEQLMEPIKSIPKHPLQRGVLGGSWPPHMGLARRLATHGCMSPRAIGFVEGGIH